MRLRWLSLSLALSSLEPTLQAFTWKILLRLPIVDGAGTAAAPVRSLYQTNSLGLRMTLETDWSMTRDGAVVTLTGVSW